MHKQTLTLSAPAKINLSLDVTGKRADGYHTVSMVMQPVSLCDCVSVTRTAGGISASTDNPEIPDGKENLAYCAAALFFSRFGIDGGADIIIEKHIPAAAGLAGGSTDAAAVLRALNELTETYADFNTLAAIGLELGADVPFCLYGKPALAEGIGEALSPAAGLTGVSIVLVNPNIPVSTRDVYVAVDAQPTPNRPDNQKLLQALADASLPDAFSEMKNVMQPVTQQICPAVSEMLAALHDLGAQHVMMSGSGPTVFGIFPPDTQPSLIPLHQRGWSAWTAVPLQKTMISWN